MPLHFELVWVRDRQSAEEDRVAVRVHELVSFDRDQRQFLAVDRVGSLTRNPVPPPRMGPGCARRTRVHRLGRLVLRPGQVHLHPVAEAHDLHRDFVVRDELAFVLDGIAVKLDREAERRAVHLAALDLIGAHRGVDRAGQLVALDGKGEEQIGTGAAVRRGQRGLPSPIDISGERPRGRAGEQQQGKHPVFHR